MLGGGFNVSLQLQDAATLLPRWVGAASFAALVGLAAVGFPGPRRVLGQPEGARDFATARRETDLETASANSVSVDISALPSDELDVIVVGGCAAGLATGACLAHSGVRSYIVVESNSRSGDKWRCRYDRLHLHDIVDMCHLPLFPVPTSFPQYPSRLQYANYLDAYQLALSVKVAYSTKVTNITKKGGDGWLVTARNMATGCERTFHAKHVVMAVGIYNKPLLPMIPGRESFQGQVIHSSEYSGAFSMGLTGKKVVVVGFGNSGAEIAVDLYEGNAALPVHVLVRSPIRVVPRRSIELLQMFAVRYVHPIYALLPGALAAAPAIVGVMDLLTIASSWISFGRITKYNLSRVKTGVLTGIALFFQPPVMDVGTMPLIQKEGADGKRPVECHRAEIASFTPTGVTLTTGVSLAADVVVFATGFEVLSEHGRLVTNGSELIGCGRQALRSGKIKGGQECQTAPGMWFVFGNLLLIRQQSMSAATAIAKRLGVYDKSARAKTTSEISLPLMLIIGAVLNCVGAYLVVKNKTK
jgi:indole-3-pyruvate monooxygenase